MTDDPTTYPSPDANTASTTPQSPHRESGVRRVFFGPEGLRSGWGALCFLLIVAALFTIIGLTAHFLLHLHTPDRKAPSGPLGALIGELVQAFVVVLAAWIMARIEGRKLAVYGYAGRARVSRFLWGCGWGFLALSALVGTLWGMHLLAFSPGHLQGLMAWKYAIAWLAVFVTVGIAEESMLRGYLQYTLTRGIGFWWAALLMSILFGAIHGNNKGESPVGLFSAGAVGLVFCISLWYTGSLWWAIGFHAAWDWAQSYFYGTPDSGMVMRGHLLTEHPVGPLLWSGGPTGPEGSLYVVPLLLIIALLMWLWWRNRGVTTPYRQDV